MIPTKDSGRAVTLDNISTGDQKQKVRQQLAGLEEKKELKEDEARERLNALLEIVEDQRKTLENAGYRWPGEVGRGEGFGGPREPPQTPSGKGTTAST
jgi:hypothetical protein